MSTTELSNPNAFVELPGSAGERWTCFFAPFAPYPSVPNEIGVYGGLNVVMPTWLVGMPIAAAATAMAFRLDVRP